MLKEFKEFILEGDLVEVAIGLILALYVKTVVDSLVADIITPVIAAVFGQPNFSSLTLDIGDGVITYGNFLNAVISFVIVGFVLFLIVKAYNTAKRSFSTPVEEEDDTAEEVLLLRQIRDSLQGRNG